MTAISLPDGLWAEIEPSGNWTVVRPRIKNPPKPTLPRGDVQWYVPYTAVHPLTAAAAPTDAIWIDVSVSSDAYYGALAAIWRKRRTFALLEHDTICRPDIIAELDACPEPWCLYGYADMCHWECREGWRNALGCTRYREELIRAVPDAMTAIPRENWDWHNMCDGLGNNLRAAGFMHHWHEPSIEHHRETHKMSCF